MAIDGGRMGDGGERNETGDEIFEEADYELIRMPRVRTFDDLNEGPHKVATTQINDKLVVLAREELGIEELKRPEIPEEFVPWDAELGEFSYEPIEIDLPRGATRMAKEGDQPDPEDPREISMLFSVEGEVRRDENGRPYNPHGRTGITGRGMLDKWGPTLAADPIVTRENPDTGELEVLLIQRGDTGEWALPGGKVDRGEAPWQAAARELAEEAGVEGINFFGAREVYAGYVDDSRNTDNAWMETDALHVHLEEDEATQVTIRAGSDAVGAQWRVINEDTLGNMFANHGDYVRLAVDVEFETVDEEEYRPGESSFNEMPGPGWFEGEN